MLAALNSAFRNLIWKFWYPIVSRTLNNSQGSHLTFMNYGYSHPALNPQSLPLSIEDEENRFFIHLYHQAAAYVDLKDLEVLEVSSGHGGGASYLARYLNPRKMLGLERNPRAVEFCRQHYDLPNLSFIPGDAQALHLSLPAESVDVVINVEASHSYGLQDRFFQGVSSILRPGGHFLTTDFRSLEGLKTWKSQLAASGLKIVKEVDITIHVIAALDQINQSRLELIRTRSPKMLHFLYKQFAGVKGSKIYQKFTSGEMVYMTFALQKI